MRALPVRRTATSALCAMLLLGIAGPTAAAADHDPARGDRARTAQAQAPVPGADALLAQTAALGDVAGVLKPVTDLLSAALEADNGRLPAAEAAKLSDAVKQAVAKATAAAPSVPQTPADPQAPNVPQIPAVPQTPNVPQIPAVPQTPDTPQTPPAETPTEPKAPTVPDVPAAPPSILPALPGAPALPLRGNAGRTAAPDLRAEALTSLQTSVDALVEATTGGDAAALGTASKEVVTGLVNFVAAVALGGGLPAPTLAGLPGLPGLPG